MKLVKKLLRRWQFWAALALLVALFLAPYQGGKQLSGSTYGRGPDGYGAWYAAVTKKSGKSAGAEPLTVERWQKPIGALPTKNTTLVQIYTDLVPDRLSTNLQAWVSQGNTLIRLGVKTATTKAPFNTILSSKAGAVRIETVRRNTAPETVGAIF
jgi:Domain of unknown function (DUF4350)